MCMYLSLCVVMCVVGSWCQWVCVGYLSCCVISHSPQWGTCCVVVPSSRCSTFSRLRHPRHYAMNPPTLSVRANSHRHFHWKFLDISGCRMLIPSVLWHCLLGVRKSIRLVKIEWWGAGVVFCLQWGADCLHMVRLMPLPSQNPIISCLI